MPPAYMKLAYGFCGISLKKVTGQYKERFLSDTRQLYKLELYKLQKCSDAVGQGRYYRSDRSPENLVLKVQTPWCQSLTPRRVR
jgi:hypothetical protein